MEWVFEVLDVQIKKALHSIIITETRLNSIDKDIDEIPILANDSIDIPRMNSQVNRVMASLGSQGFELVSVTSVTTPEGSLETKYFFKKPKR